MKITEHQLADLLITLENGGRPAGGVSSITNGVPSVGGEHLTADGGFDFSKVKYVPEEYFQNMRRGHVQTDDILIVKDGATTGKVSFVTRDFPFKKAAVNEHVFILRVNKDKVLSKFLFYYLFSPPGQKKILANYRGAAIGGINQSFTQNTIIPLVPLPEQERIVRLLDEAESLRAIRERANERMEQFVPALFQEMFGDLVKNEKNWKTLRFGEVCESRLGKMLDDKQQSGLHLRSYLRNQNVQWDKVDISKVAQMDFDEKDRVTFQLQEGDLLICEGGEVGRTAIWRNELPECYFQKAIHRARPNLT